MIKNFATYFAVTLAALAVAGCGAGSLLQTGSVSKQPVAAVPTAATPVDRALHVAATSARAHKCGFYFDAAALRTNFLAAEAGRGTAGDLLTKAGQSYDYTALKVASSIKKSEAFCTKARTASIKTSLQGALAGNFEPPTKAVAARSSGLFDLFESDTTGPEKFNREAIYDPAMAGEKKY